MNGKVSNIIQEKRFGFIYNPESRREYFFHREDYHGNWDQLVSDYQERKQINVQFHIVESQRGPRAGNVVRVE